MKIEANISLASVVVTLDLDFAGAMLATIFISRRELATENLEVVLFLI